jgi:hypothetical protein
VECAEFVCQGCGSWEGGEVMGLGRRVLWEEFEGVCGFVCSCVLDLKYAVATCMHDLVLMCAFLAFTI